MRNTLGQVAWISALGLTILAVAPNPSADGDTAGGGLTATVTREDLAIEVNLSGTFVADDKDEVRIEPESYRGDLIITQLVAEGRSVKKGDVLIGFDQSSLEDSQEEAQDDLAARQVELDKAQADQKTWEIEESRKKARRDRDLSKASDALAKAQEEAAMALKDKDQGLLDAADRVKDAEVDYEQLIQLYEERELHTATENILIERQKRSLESTRRGAEKTQKEYDIWKKYDHLTDVQDKELDLDDKKADVEKGEIQAAAEKAEKDAAVSKFQRALDKATRKSEELGRDAGSLQVLSPRDGIVFYGTIGSDSPSDFVIIGMNNDSDEMKIGGRIRTHQVLMTVASMEHLSVKMSALESDIQYLKPGLPVLIRPNAFPALAIDGELTKVDQVASRTGILSDLRQFTVLGRYEDTFPQLRSGMNCRVTVRADSIPECLQVPVLAVFQEGGEHYCHVVDGSKTSRRKVKIGATNGTRVEIQEGLRDGETVSLHDPSAG